MVPTLSERLRRRAYECYSPRHIRVPWQVSPELPTALTGSPLRRQFSFPLTQRFRFPLSRRFSQCPRPR